MRVGGVQDGFQNVTITMWTDPKAHTRCYPKLKGKAIEIKQFAETLRWYWVNHMNTEELGWATLELGIYIGTTKGSRNTI